MFIKFLVDRAIVKKEDVLEAVMLQMESMPSLLRILIEDDIVSKDKLFDLVLISGERSESLLEILKREGGLTSDDLFEVVSRQNQKSLSLGDILIKEKKVVREDYDQALREYSINKDKISLKREEQVQNIADSCNNEEVEKSKPAISAAALESLMAVQGIDQSQLAELEEQVPEKEEIAVPDEMTNDDEEKFDDTFFQEYIDFYSDVLQSDLFVVANRFRLKGREKDLPYLHENFSKLLSLCKLNEFSLQIKLLEAHERIIDMALSGQFAINKDWQSEPFHMLEILWEFRSVLISGADEVDAFNDEKFKESYMNSIKRVITLSKRTS